MKNQMYVSFFLRKGRLNSNDQSPVYCRVRVAGKVADFSTGKFVKPDCWNAKSCLAERDKNANIVNKHLTMIRADLNKIESDLSVMKITLSADLIKDKYHGVEERKRSLLDAIEYHNENMLASVGTKGNSQGTYERYLILKKKIADFIKHHYHRNDINLDEIKTQFVINFEAYLKTKYKIKKQNSAMLYMVCLKKVLNVAVVNDWMPKNMFQGYKIVLSDPDPKFLTEDVRDKIIGFKSTYKRQQTVVDMFTFACYTGLSKSDLKTLTIHQIVINMQGEYGIQKKRDKSGNPFFVPLLPQAISIYKKYLPLADPATGRLFPARDHHSYNRSLKNIAEKCGVTENLSSHVARHTFATWFLTQGGTMETLKKMLGHKQFKSTEVYGRITDQRAQSEMNQIRINMASEKRKKKVI